MIVMNFNDQAIKPDNRINSLQRSVAPLLNFLIYEFTISVTFEIS